MKVLIIDLYRHFFVWFEVKIKLFGVRFIAFCFIYVQFQFLVKPLIILELLNDLWYTVVNNGLLPKQTN